MKQNQDVKIHSICDDILVYAQRVTIPEIPQKKMQREFYVGHFCISRIKTLCEAMCTIQKWIEKLKML